jgi:hypothetical protein
MDRRKLESAVAAYPYLRGLFALPLALLCTAAALGNWQWGPFRHDAVFLAAVAAAGLLAAAINHYYNENFGRVTPSGRAQVRAAAASAAGVAVMVLGSLLLRSRASWSLDLPVNPVAAMFGLLMLMYYGAVVGVRPHHAVVWGSLLVAGALPVWTGADPSNVGLVMAAAAAVVNGLLDHRLLVRSLSPGAPTTAEAGRAGG